MHPRISVAICTHNRSHYLAKALQSLAQQTIEADEYEVLVVDNASNDDTRNVVEKFAGIPNLRYIFEPELGLSFARNRALTAATGKIIAYLDDDAIAVPGWIARLLDAFDCIAGPVACVGGKIDPIWEKPQPAWLPSELIRYFTILDYGPDRRQLDPVTESVYGANMAFLREALLASGGFDPGLGRVGDHLLSCEEILVQHRLVAAGYEIHYDPVAAVAHHIIQARVDPDWLAQRAFWQGASEAAMNIRLREMTAISRVIEALRRILPLIAGPLVRIVRRPRYRKDANRVCLRCRRMSLLGAIYGYLALQTTT